MTRTPSEAGASANPAARLVDLAAYREARRREADSLPLFARDPAPASGERRVLSDHQVAHRMVMLRHLEAGLK